MLWVFVGPTGVYLLDFFCSGIQFNLLLSPYPCFISLLYLDLYVFGDDALISEGSFMQTKYLCVLIHIWIKGEVGAVKLVYPSSKSILLTVPRRCFFLDRFCKLCFVLVCVVLSCLFFVALWSPAGKGLTSWLSCLLYFVTFPNVSWSTSVLRAMLAP